MNDTSKSDPLLETLRTRLGAQYAIDGLLGQGGMGSVDPRRSYAVMPFEVPSSDRDVRWWRDLTVYVRTFSARARLYEQLDEREKAIAAWEEFLRRWADGDATAEPARREARAALLTTA